MGRTRARRLTRRAIKLLRLFSVPSYRRALRHGVAATIEHNSVPFLPGLRSVIDVGANRGQFAAFALERFPCATVDCFEPLAEARERLTAALGSDQRVRVHAYACGAQRGRQLLHVARRDDSSSLLPIGERQVSTFPGTEEAGTVNVDVVRLDEIIGEPEVVRPSLLKIDVQGGELDVLRGAERLLPAIDQALVECSFVEFYEGQAMAAEVIEYLRTQGLRLSGRFSPVFDRHGACLQADLLFERTGVPSDGGE